MDFFIQDLVFLVVSNRIIVSVLFLLADFGGGSSCDRNKDKVLIGVYVT